MSGNGEPTNDDGTDDGTDDGKPKNTGKVLREKLETTLTENQVLKGKLLVYESGLGHLNERQQRAVIREASEDGKELTAELLKEVARDLGYAEPPKPEPKNDGEGANQDGQGGNDGDEQVTVEDALNSMDAIERASRQSLPDNDPNSFQNKLMAARSSAEVEALIKREGHKVGIVHETDVD